MEELACLKSAEKRNGDCIICKEFRQDILYNATTKGLQSLKVAAEKRQHLKDVANLDIIERILSTAEDNIEDVCRHKKCFAVFSDKGKITRLKKQLSSFKKNPQATSSGLRSRISSANCNSCIFCQESKG